MAYNESLKSTSRAAHANAAHIFMIAMFYTLFLRRYNGRRDDFYYPIWMSE